ncbi:MAG: hypothetical protein P1R58_05675 [bacterium]|nr:hypothetical protein [bacterium]
MRTFLVAALFTVGVTSTVVARQPLSAVVASAGVVGPDDVPAYCQTVHDIGRLGLVIQNNGTFGLHRQFYSSTGRYGFVDCLTGESISYGAEFPLRSKIEHLSYASLWVGAVSHEDTLVSTGLDGWENDGREFHPPASPEGDMVYRSILEEEAAEPALARSEQDFIAVYYDTLSGSSNDYFSSRRHIPLGLEVTQSSYAWAYSYSQDLVIVDLKIRNLGHRVMKDTYVGLHVDGDVGFRVNYEDDDLTGFMKTFPAKGACDFEDTLNVAWIADNDGDPVGGEFIYDVDVRNPLNPPQNNPGVKSATNVLGARVLRAPTEKPRFSYNWWTSNYYTWSDFGPRHKSHTRDFRTGGIGTPSGDINKYWLMSNGEVDYDQAFMPTITESNPLWMKPSRWLDWYLSRGQDVQFLMSYGPVDVTIGESINFTFALIGGLDFHVDPTNYSNLYGHPLQYNENLNFYSLAKSARHAGWIYDNPGIDTDGDGYYGKFRICVLDSSWDGGQYNITSADTTFYEGDGVPDFRGALPPPIPFIEVTPILNGVHVRFNGQESERTVDYLTDRIDFEGYHIYSARDERISSYSLLASYDRDNWDKWIFNPRYPPHGRYELHELPFTEEELRCLYGNSCDDKHFHPGNYTVGHVFIHPDFPDSVFYFSEHGANTDEFGKTSPIKRVYPEAEIPPLDTDLDTLGPEWFTAEHYLKAYEYEYTIDNLLPTVPYWISVTTFDHGSPKADLEPLETSIKRSALMRYPAGSADQLTGGELEVYVYPNPYRYDDPYRRKGFEGRMQQDLPSEKVRAIHFANLPPKCKISIFSIDGDLIREIDHDMSPDDPNHLYDEWNLVSRNRMSVVSGLYYWVVQSDSGRTQMGKLAIIL